MIKLILPIGVDMTVAENIDALLRREEISAAELARTAGVTPATVHHWRNGVIPREEPIKRMCLAYGLSRDDIVSDSVGLATRPRFGRSARPRGAVGARTAAVPVLGRVHAGPAAEPDVFDEGNGEVEILASYVERDPEVHVLDYEGDCMNKVFGEGTTSLVVSPNSPFGNGDIVVAVVDGTDYVVRRLGQTARELRLMPSSTNPEHSDIVVSRGDGHRVEFRGKVLECFKRFE